MTQILIAAFDRYAEAEKVKAELVSEGVSSDDIQISASFNADNVDSSRVEVVGEEPDEDATVADKIGSFFHKVFGDGSSQHAGRYPEAARRGSTIVTVTLEDDSRVSTVERVMERNGAIDIDERCRCHAGDRQHRDADHRLSGCRVDQRRPARTGRQRHARPRPGFWLDPGPRGERKSRAA